MIPNPNILDLATRIESLKPVERLELLRRALTPEMKLCLLVEDLSQKTVDLDPEEIEDNLERLGIGALQEIELVKHAPEFLSDLTFVELPALRTPAIGVVIAEGNPYGLSVYGHLSMRGHHSAGVVGVGKLDLRTVRVVIGRPELPHALPVVVDHTLPSGNASSRLDSNSQISVRTSCGRPLSTN